MDLVFRLANPTDIPILAQIIFLMKLGPVTILIISEPLLYLKRWKIRFT